MERQKEATKVHSLKNSMNLIIDTRHNAVLYLKDNCNDLRVLELLFKSIAHDQVYYNTNAFLKPKNLSRYLLKCDFPIESISNIEFENSISFLRVASRIEKLKPKFTVIDIANTNCFLRSQYNYLIDRFQETRFIFLVREPDLFDETINVALRVYILNSHSAKYRVTKKLPSRKLKMCYPFKNS